MPILPLTAGGRPLGAAAHIYQFIKNAKSSLSRLLADLLRDKVFYSLRLRGRQALDAHVAAAAASCEHSQGRQAKDTLHRPPTDFAVLHPAERDGRNPAKNDSVTMDNIVLPKGIARYSPALPGQVQRKGKQR